MDTKMTELWTGPVDKEWVDYNGHMNDSAYARVFSMAVDELMDKIGIHADFLKTYHYTIYTLETHLVYLDEAYEGQNLHVSLQLLDHDKKRLHVFFEMRDSSDNRIATSEQMLMGMDTSEGRPSPFIEPIAETIRELAQSHNELAWPNEAGRTIGIRKK